MVKQFDVHMVNLDPTIISEMKKARPCLILSPKEMNSVLGTVIKAPMATTLHGYPSRLELGFNNKFCEVCLDQTRAVDGTRLSKQSLGRIKSDESESVKDIIAKMFDL